MNGNPLFKAVTLFKQRKNKRFKYSPRFQESKEKGRKENFQEKWEDIKPASKRKGTVFANLPLLLMLLAALLILVYMLRSYE